jgi:hypothetical protein
MASSLILSIKDVWKCEDVRAPRTLWMDEMWCLEHFRCISMISICDIDKGVLWLYCRRPKEVVGLSPGS